MHALTMLTMHASMHMRHACKQTGIIDLLPAPEELPPVEATLLDKAGHGKPGRNKAAAASPESPQGATSQGAPLVTRVRTKDEKLLALAFKVRLRYRTLHALAPAVIRECKCSRFVQRLPGVAASRKMAQEAPPRSGRTLMGCAVALPAVALAGRVG